MPRSNFVKVFIGLLIIQVSMFAQSAEVRGRVSVENRYFLEDSQNQASIVVEPDAYWSWNDNSDSLTFKPYYRHDSIDDERSHADIRELYWLHVADAWELKVGIEKVYWGVAESQHLVDVINQTDAVESVDGEEKLGQPMVSWSTIQSWGVLDIYLLPYFRERTFPAEKGRLGGPFVIDTDNVLYESSKEQRNIDYAIRWGHTFGDWDVGLSYFDGTNRDPKLFLNPFLTNPVLTPFYDQMQQVGLSVQATLGSWLWKAEAIHRSDSAEKFSQAVLGFEYTFVGIAGSFYDLGLLMEFNRDSRGLNSPSFFQKDLFVGGRLVLNDIQSSELLFGIGQDLDDSKSYSGLLEGSRRLGNNWKMSVNAAFFQSDSIDDPVYIVRDEDHVELALEYFF